MRRASFRCEYCHLPVQGQVAAFPIDHIEPRSRGGQTVLANLALACPHCNAHQWAHTADFDPETGREEPLFNPRTDEWNEHFVWSSEDSCILVGKTPRGRATIARLQMNHANVIAVRRLLVELGLFPETSR